MKRLRWALDEGRQGGTGQLNVFVSSETGLVAGVALGHEIPIGTTLGLAPEVFIRVSGADELSTMLLGLAISVVPVGARGRTP